MMKTPARATELAGMPATEIISMSLTTHKDKSSNITLPIGMTFYRKFPAVKKAPSLICAIFY
jgi:hypothetical protein